MRRGRAKVTREVTNFTQAPYRQKRIPFSWELNENSFDGVLKNGMVMCVETYVGRFSGGPGLNLKSKF